MSPPFDPRLTPARADLAAAHLKGEVEAARYVEGEWRRVIEPTAPLKRTPSGAASLDTEALYGERARVFEDDGEGWSWVQLERDGYVGYMPSEALAPESAPATHKVRALRTFIFPGPDIKLPPVKALSFASPVAVRELRDRFAVTAEGFLHAGHLTPLEEVETEDFVTVATRFLGVPYLWGGRSSLGLDCSGLTQTALMATGTRSPRDSDMQEAALGEEIPLDGPFRRGDLLFWAGHVAIVEDPQTLLHANAHHMAVAREPLAPALARIAAAGLPLRTARRL